jgi:hypothetical protein
VKPSTHSKDLFDHSFIFEERKKQRTLQLIDCPVFLGFFEK